MRQRGSMSDSELVSRAQFAAGLTQEGLGEHLGSSRRTVTRWARSQAHPSDRQRVEMVRLAHARDPAVAAQLAAGIGETLESLGIVAPAPPPAPPMTTLLVQQAIVHAAAEAMDLSPRAVRVGLQAAIKRARELGATIEEVEAALALAPLEPKETP